MTISAYIPSHNSEHTLAATVRSIRDQGPLISELFIVDDGSTDGSRAVADQLRVRVIQHPGNLGRGATRARALREAKSDLVLSCDASMGLAPNFLTTALPWFDQPATAAVFGRVTQPETATAVQRWRRRHLFKAEHPAKTNVRASLATGGVLLRRNAVLGVGNFDCRCREGEDAELGRRLLAAGWQVVFDPALDIRALGDNTLDGVLARYQRWNLGTSPPVGWKDYWRQIRYSIRVMALEDLRRGDLLVAGISLLWPHRFFWRGRARRTLEPPPSLERVQPERLLQAPQPTLASFVPGDHA